MFWKASDSDTEHVDIDLSYHMRCCYVYSSFSYFYCYCYGYCAAVDEQCSPCRSYAIQQLRSSCLPKKHQASTIQEAAKYIPRRHAYCDFAKRFLLILVYYGPCRIIKMLSLGTCGHKRAVSSTPRFNEDPHICLSKRHRHRHRHTHTHTHTYLRGMRPTPFLAYFSGSQTTSPMRKTRNCLLLYT